MPNPIPEQLTCPACHATMLALALVPWGNGQQRTLQAPWICGECAALGILDLASWQIILTSEVLWQPVQEHNPALWQQIVEMRAQIKGESDG